MGADEIAQFDDILANIASDYSKQVRGQIARLIASSLSPFSRSAQRFAMDDIEVARPILEHSEILTDATLLQVVEQKSQDHMMAVTRRRRISEAVSQALVERGDDAVVTSLLTNQKAEIGSEAYVWWPSGGNQPHAQRHCCGGQGSDRIAERSLT